MGKTWKEWAFVLTIAGCIQALILITISMLFYPGGTADNHMTSGYSLVGNALSDLGRVTSYSGASNFTAALLYNSSVFALGVLIIPYLIAIHQLMIEESLARWLCIFGALVGVVMALAMIGGSLTPADTNYDTHVSYGAVGFMTGIPVVIFLATALYLEESYPKRYSLVFFVLAIIQFVFIVLLFQQLSTGGSNSIFAIGQKISVYGLILGFVFQSHGALMEVQSTRQE